VRLALFYTKHYEEIRNGIINGRKSKYSQRI
jgi:hypothetical protein